MPEPQTTGKNRHYGLGCLPFVVMIILFIIAVVILLIVLMLNSNAQISGNELINIDDMTKHILQNKNAAGD